MSATLIVWTAGDAIFPASIAPQAKFTVGSNFPYMTLAYDKDDIEKAYFHGVIPSYYGDGNITVDVYWTTTGTGDVQWGIKFLGLVDDEVFDAAMSSATTSTDTITAANDLMITSFTLSSPALVNGDYLIIELQRVATAGADTGTADALFLALELTG